jgi:hypothetical protein
MELKILKNGFKASKTMNYIQTLRLGVPAFRARNHLSA